MKKCILSLLGLAVSVVAGQSADKVLVFDAASVKVADKNLVFGVTGRDEGRARN